MSSNFSITPQGSSLVNVLILAIACWTSLPQVVAIAEAKEAAEHLFTVALDGILVVDEQGIIRQANPATEFFFGINPFILLGSHLQKWLPKLPEYPEQWIGRSEHTLQKFLFDPFFTTKSVGTGLGLSISYKIITEKHQGKLKCISPPGKGTEFAIIISLSQSRVKN